MTLVDLDLPSDAAIGAIPKIRARDPGAHIIGLSTYEPDAACFRVTCAPGCWHSVCAITVSDP